MEPKMNATHSITAADMAHRLKGVKKGAQWFVNCVAHDDKNASLALKDSGGKVLIYCHGGCGQAAVIDALKELGLWGSSDNGDHGTKRRKNLHLHRRERRSPISDRPFAGEEIRGEATERRQGIRGVRRVLYRLPEVVAASDVFVCEGEKDSDTVAKMGLCGTTAAFGAKGAWEPGYTASLVGKHVVILPDADEPGRQRAAKVAAALSGAVASLKVLDLFPDRTDGSDLYDWAGQFEDPQEAGERLCVLADNVAEWEPPEPGTVGDDLPEHGAGWTFATWTAGRSSRCGRWSAA
jgi:5S rRNA maturation endonuclease (ribonuclease M5)